MYVRGQSLFSLPQIRGLAGFFKIKSYGAMATFGPGKEIYRSRILIDIAWSLNIQKWAQILKIKAYKSTNLFYPSSSIKTNVCGYFWMICFWWQFLKMVFEMHKTQWSEDFMNDLIIIKKHPVYSCESSYSIRSALNYATRMYVPGWILINILS